MQLDHEPATPLSSPTANRLLSLPRALQMYVGTILALCVITLLAILHYHFAGYPTSDLGLWRRDYRFGDLYQYQPVFRYLHSSSFFTAGTIRFAYPAPCAIFFALLYTAGSHVHAVYVALFAVTLLSSAFAFFRWLAHSDLEPANAAILAIFLMATSYPWIFLYAQGNIEFFLYALLATGLWAYLSGRRTLAAVLWGCAGSMKIYPLAMLAVFLKRSTRRQLFVGLFTATAIFFFSFWYVGPTIGEAAMGTLNGLRGFLGQTAGGVSPLGVDHSILGALKALFSAGSLHTSDQWGGVSKAYQLLLIVGAPLLWFGRIRKLPIENQLCLLFIAIVLFPPVSFDYTLIHTYLALGIVISAYLSSVRRGHAFPAANVLFIAFAILATPQTWVQNHTFRLNGVIKCAALVTIFIVLLRYRLTDDSEGSPNTSAVA